MDMIRTVISEKLMYSSDSYGVTEARSRYLQLTTRLSNNELHPWHRDRESSWNVTCHVNVCDQRNKIVDTWQLASFLHETETNPHLRPDLPKVAVKSGKLHIRSDIPQIVVYNMGALSAHLLVPGPSRGWLITFKIKIHWIHFNSCLPIIICIVPCTKSYSTFILWEFEIAWHFFTHPVDGCQSSFNNAMLLSRNFLWSMVFYSTGRGVEISNQIIKFITLLCEAIV